MSLHLIAEDPTPDEPTVPAPTVCPTCVGTRVLSMSWVGGSAGGWRHNPCPDCCCEVCGRPTETPPLCERCDTKQKEGTWPSPNPIPAGPTANPKTRDEPTSTFPTRAGDETQRPEGNGRD